MGQYDFELKESDWDSYEVSEHASIGDTVNHHYGMTTAIITPKDLEALQYGEVIIYDVEGEYRIAIKMGKDCETCTHKGDTKYCYFGGRYEPIRGRI